MVKKTSNNKSLAENTIPLLEVTETCKIPDTSINYTEK
jgi:hypothetical protein